MQISTRVIFLLLMCWLANVTGSFAQSTEPQPVSKHSLKAGCGVVPVQFVAIGITGFFDAIFYSFSDWEKVDETFPVLAVNADYTYELSNRVQVGVTCTYVGWQRTFVARQEDQNDPEMSIKSIEKNRSWGVMPKIAYKWMNRDNVQLYTSYAMGINPFLSKERVTGMPEEKRWKSYTAFQLNFIGVNFQGKGRVGGFLEAGFGFAGLLNTGFVVRL